MRPITPLLALLAACGPEFDPSTEGYLDGHITSNGCDMPETVTVTLDTEDDPPAQELEVSGHGFGAALAPGEYLVGAMVGGCSASAGVSITQGEVTDLDLDLVEMEAVRAPYLYLYPKEPTATAILLPDHRRVIESEPPYPRGGWDLLALPGGTVLTPGGPRHYLYYELALDRAALQLERGWCVRGAQAQASVEAAMADLGFLPAEIEDFSDFWDPVFPSRAWQTVYPQGPELYPLIIDPAPEQVVRANFAIRAGCHPTEPWQAAPVSREGFHAAEWGVLLLDGQDAEIETGW
ncbi:MAG: hypothetical protein ABIO70_11640 [Pseudomonadota bacterium]